MLDAASLQVLWTPIIVPTAMGTWALVQWWGHRRDRRQEKSLSESERTAKAMAAERAALSADQSALFERLERAYERETRRAESCSEDAGRLRELVRELESDLDRVCGLANEARQMVRSVQRLSGMAMTEFEPVRRLRIVHDIQKLNEPEH